jgi:ATP-dependent helicase HrpB
MPSLSILQRLRLAEILAGRLTHQQRRELDRLAPAELLVPSGPASRWSIEVKGIRSLAVKLQELFGMTGTRASAGAQSHHHPFALTAAGRGSYQDLARLLQNTYRRSGNSAQPLSQNIPGRKIHSPPRRRARPSAERDPSVEDVP